MILQELLTQEKAQSSTSVNQEVDLDELMDVSLMEFSVFYDVASLFHSTLLCFYVGSCASCIQDPELEKLHADRIAVLKVRN